MQVIEIEKQKASERKAHTEIRKRRKLKRECLEHVWLWPFMWNSVSQFEQKDWRKPDEYIDHNCPGGNGFQNKVDKWVAHTKSAGNSGRITNKQREDSKNKASRLSQLKRVTNLKHQKTALLKIRALELSTRGWCWPSGLQCCVALQPDTKDSEEHTVFIFCNVPPKRWYLPRSQKAVTTPKTDVDIFTTVRTWEVHSVYTIWSHFQRWNIPRYSIRTLLTSINKALKWTLVSKKQARKKYLTTDTRKEKYKWPDTISRWFQKDGECSILTSCRLAILLSWQLRGTKTENRRPIFRPVFGFGLDLWDRQYSWHFSEEDA